ncbi:MAG: DUF6569 family protein [Bacteroidia bacterium]
MKNLKTLLMLLVSSSAIAQYNTKNLALEKQQNIAACSYKNLALYPVHASQTFVAIHKNVGNYVPLKKAIEGKKLKITEVESGGTVNKMYALNVSRDTVIILGGEIVKGGKQDRMVAQDILIPPGNKKIDLSVFCVEQHRWTAGDRRGSGSDIKPAQFENSYKMSGTEVRKAALVNKNQSDVWDKVSETTSKNKTVSTTGTYTVMDSNADFKKSMDEYTAYFKKQFTPGTDIIGFIAVSGDKILGCDLFANNNMFIQQLDNLINSYATEAITSGKQPSVSYAKVAAYYNDLLGNESLQDGKIKEKGTQLKNKQTKLHMAVY